jgi:hypothetical protein
MSNALTQEGRLTAATQTLTLSLAGDAGAMIQVADTFTGTLAFLATADGQNYVAIAGTPVGGGTGATTATVGGIWTFSVGGLLALRVSATALSAGAARVTMRAVEASGAGGGGGGGGTALLPTAVVNQMIISQGVGVQPVFSAIAECGTFRTHDAGSFICPDGTFQGPQFQVLPAPFSSLPTAVGNAGVIRGVSDSSVIVWGATVLAGGTSNVLVRSNGTNWTIVGI